MSIIGSSFTSTTVTLVYGSASAKFAAGDTIVVSGMSPSTGGTFGTGYNGSYSVLSIGTDITTGAPNVTMTNNVNTAATTLGIAFNGSVKYQRAAVPSTAGFNTSNIIITNGLVYQPGTSQAANFTYSQ